MAIFIAAIGDEIVWVWPESGSVGHTVTSGLLFFDDDSSMFNIIINNYI